MKTLSITTALLVTSTLIACGGPPSAEAPVTPDAPAPPAVQDPAVEEVAQPASVQVTLEAKSGSTLKGSATLTAVDGGVNVVMTVEGISPGKHGAHVHETGDCSSADGKSAGGHYNPATHDHALPPSGPRHLGDLGNIEIAEDGSGKLEIVLEGANLTPGDPSSLLGRAIIVHAKEDDGGQPTGNAGGRIGCGVIPAG